MAAPQQDAPEGDFTRRSRWTEPDPAAVAAQIEAFSTLTNRQFGAELAAFVAADEADRDKVVAYAIRSPKLTQKARRLIPDLVRQPDKYLLPLAEEANNARIRRLAQFRARADHEAQLLERVWAGIVARRGHLLPEPRPRSRARRRLADEYPERFLELVREEEVADQERAEERRRERDAEQAASAKP
ncbi:hypothetical protein KUF83_30055 [Streptomyces sp. BV286]|uniref:hypothetical protein n=1 Tax=Streptomyces sp. BV286 TaxID=2849672 RepID=UPI001C2EA5E6|nr:hypothetical protein [Streptomyces sp. BV286]MBV1940780.1 hypothetical protein [Streptomyces sp. BV286]